MRTATHAPEDMSEKITQLCNHMIGVFEKLRDNKANETYNTKRYSVSIWWRTLSVKNRKNSHSLQIQYVPAQGKSDVWEERNRSPHFSYFAVYISGSEVFRVGFSQDAYEQWESAERLPGEGRADAMNRFYLAPLKRVLRPEHFQFEGIEGDAIAKPTSEVIDAVLRVLDNSMDPENKLSATVQTKERVSARALKCL